MRIDIRGLTHTYPGEVMALQGVSLVVEAGESVAIVGENGAGKTTLARHLNGLLRPTAGQVVIGDWDTRDVSIARLSARVGYVFQNPDDQLFERTVRAEVGFALRNRGGTAESIAERVSEALRQVGLIEQLDQHPYDLHLSQRRLVALAATLVMDVPILVLDEPTMGQDVRGLNILGQVIEDHLAAGRTVITITHDLDFAARHFERIIVMSGGRILLDGLASEVLTQHPVLLEAGVEPPQLVRLAAKLDLPDAPRTAEAFIEAWREHQRGA
jgi:energy-coupling factor transport system ATP-binding protein